VAQSKKRAGRRSSSAPGKSAQRRAASASRSSRAIVKQPIEVVARPPLRARIDKAFPPFSLKRYLAIWVLGMIPLVALILVLARGGGTGGPSSSPTQGASMSATQSVTALTSTPSVSPTQVALTPTQVSPNGSVSATPIGATQTSGKYMVIETTRGRIVARLYTDPSAGVARTIANFEQKANAGYFNGLSFHRVEDWMVQGGDPTGTGQGGGGMAAEYNQLPFKAGALGVTHPAESAINNDSQFFIVKTDAQYLNGQYTNWGQVVEGMDVVNSIVVNDKMTRVIVEDRP